jgi:hypothetical protein
MSKDYKKELEQMQHLMNYGLNESNNTTSSKGIVEYSQKGADGKTYGIIREGTKYFVKVAPKKDTQVLAEDYEYIGGFLNRKAHDSYTKASNALNLELIHVNESCGSKQPVKSQFNINESAEWENAQTKETRAELSRFYQLCENVDNLLSENVHYIKEEKNGPYTESGKIDANKNNGGGHSGNEGKQQPLGIKDKDYVNNDKQVNPDTVYNKNGVKGTSPSGEYKAACGNNKVTYEQGDPYDNNAKSSKEQGKSVANENKKRVIKLSEEQTKQVLAWRNDRAFVHQSSDSELDRSHGTEIGDTAPYNDKVNENFETTEWDNGLPTKAGVGDAKKYKQPFDNQNGVTQPVTEDALDGKFIGDYGNPDIESSARNILSSDLDADDSSIYKHLEDYGEGPESIGIDFDDDPLANIPDDDNDPTLEINPNTYDSNDGTQSVYEAVKRIVETQLNDFGKHPAWRKKVMTLPPNADGSEWGEDWNDETAKGELPYGKKIGDSAPFDDIVNDIANAVVTSLSKKKE